IAYIDCLFFFTIAPAPQTHPLSLHDALPISRPAGPPRGAGPSRRSRALVPTLIVLAVLTVAYLLVVNFWTERLWFDSVDFTSVLDRKSTRLNSSHVKISYAVFCLKKKK